MSTYLQKLHEVLTHCQKEELLFGFSYWDDDKDSFIVGFVKSLTKKRVAFDLVSSDGERDDTWEGELSDIQRFHYDSEYLRGLKAFSANREASIENLLAVPSYSHENGSLYLDFLKKAQSLGRVVTILDDDHDKTCGLVTEVGSDYVEIQVIEEETGRVDGTYILDADDIHSLSCAGIREMQIEFLHRTRYALP